jgi:aspartate kinase
MIVMKFGGSSLAGAERIRAAAEIVCQAWNAGKKPVVVLSAMGDTTDDLLSAAAAARDEGFVSVDRIEALHMRAIEELDLSIPQAHFAGDELLPLFGEMKSLLTGISLTRELSPRTRDRLVSFGERLSVRIFAIYLSMLGIEAKALDAWDAGMVSDGNYGQAELLDESWEALPRQINPLIEAGVLPVITGFIAKNKEGVITTLGRGGSDLSATMIAAACGAEEVQVWKDVDGILSADPRIVPQARPVVAVSYNEAAEMAYFGAQVLHPRAMQPCIKSGVPARVLNSYNPSAVGTRILEHLEWDGLPLRTIVCHKKVTLMDIASTRMLGQAGFMAELFACFGRHGISVDMVATSEVSVSLTLDADYELQGLLAELQRIASVKIHSKRAIITLIGDVHRSSEILSRAFSACLRLGVRVQMLSQGASKVNISFIVNDSEAEDSVRGLHKEFFE